jgi:hypothetical protein
MKRSTILFLTVVAGLFPMVAYAQSTAVPLETKSPIEMWNAIAAIAASLLASIFIQKGWTKGQQAAAAIVASIIVALVGQWLTDGFKGEGWENPTLAIVKVITLTQIAYQTLFQAIPLPQWLESKTGGDDLKDTNPQKIRDVKSDGVLKRVMTK